MKEKAYKTASGNIHYWINIIDDDAITLVFLPGLTLTHRLFDIQIEYFKGKYNVFAWDAPGHGASWPFEFNFDMMGKARWLNEILEQEKISKPVIVGHSIGGYLGQAYAELYPEKIKGFVAIDLGPAQKRYMTPGEIALIKRMSFGSPTASWEMITNVSAIGLAESAYGRQLVKEMMQDYKGNEKWLTQVMEHGTRILGETMEADFAYDIPCPALLICGEKDKLGLFIRYNKAWHKETGIPIEWIKDAGHNSNTDQPEIVNQLIDDFVKNSI